jgi:hypothetical protein
MRIGWGCGPWSPGTKYTNPPASIPLGGVRRLILGHASAREMRISDRKLRLEGFCEKASPLFRGSSFSSQIEGM